MPVYLVLIVMLTGAGSAYSSSLLNSQLAEESECTLICSDSVDVFTRPDSSALFMSRLAPRNQVEVSGRTEDGWLGFDPGVAQAANIGSFRLRWIAGDAGFVIDGELESVPVVWGPAAGIAYAMIYEALPLYSEPDKYSVIVDSIPSSSAAGIVARTDDWYLLNLSIGPLAQDSEGWIMADEVSVNGDFENIPYIE